MISTSVYVLIYVLNSLSLWHMRNFRHVVAVLPIYISNKHMCLKKLIYSYAFLCMVAREICICMHIFYIKNHCTFGGPP